MPNPRFHPFMRLVLCALAVLVSATVVVTLVMVVLAGVGLLAMPSIGPTMGALATSTRFSAAILAAQAPAILFAVVLCRLVLDSRSVSSLGLRLRNAPQFFGGAFCGFLAIAFLFGLLWIGGHIQIGGWSERAQEIGLSGIALRLGFWALVMLGVGVAEETLFRGYALHNLSAWLGSDKTGLGAAAIVQAILFGSVHLMNLSGEKATYALQALPNLVLIGLFFAFCAFKTGSLWFPIGFHAAWNFFLGSVFSLPVSGLATFRLLQTEVSGSRWLTGGAFGGEGSVLLTILIIAMIYLVRRSPDHPQFIGDIATLQPEYEPDYIEVASRAPSLRERKELRRTQTVTSSNFEGWNDLAPPQNQRYSTYQPQQPTPEIAPETAEQVTNPTTNSDAFPAAAFAQDAPLETLSSAPSAAPTETDFAHYRPSVSAPVAAPVAVEVAPTEASAPTELPQTASKLPADALPLAALPSEEKPPQEKPLEKPPAPRW